MKQEQNERIELPKAWKALNFYSLNLAYCFIVFLVSLQVSSVKEIIVKAFKEDFYNTLNAWVLMLFLITASGAGILGFVRMISVKKIINILESGKDDRAQN